MTDLSMHRAGLPVERTPLYGRADAFHAIGALLDGGARLVSVTGIAGIGKTRMAREVARVIGAGWSGGTVFCSFRPTTSVDEMLAVVMEACGVPPGDTATREGRAERVLKVLTERGRTLLVADDLQRAGNDTRAIVAAWLDRVPSLQILVTGREPMGIQGERSLELKPLETTAGDDHLESPAVAFFLRAAANVGAFVDGSASELTAVTELVRRLDGNPLAIELAAARTPLLSAQAMLGRLEERFVLLRPVDVGLGQGLWESLNDSWAALSVREQRALMQLSVFRGGASLEALEEVGLVGDEMSVLDVFGRLALRSLIVSRGGAVRRVDVYESISTFALAQIALQPQLEVELWRRSLCWSIEHARRIVASGGLTSRGPRLADEVANMIALFRDGRGLTLNPDLRADIARVFTGLAWSLVTHMSLADLLSTARWLLGTTEALAPMDRIRLMGLEISLLTRIGDRAAAEAAFDRVMTYADTTNDAHLRGLALKQTAALSSFLPARTIVAQLTDAIALLGDAGTPADVGHALADLAFARARLGETDAADRAFAAAVEALAGATEPERTLTAVNNWGVMHTLLGNWERARHLLLQALEIGEESDNRKGICVVRCSLGECELQAGRVDVARALFENALEEAEEMGFSSHHVQAAGYLAAIEHFAGAFETARAYYSDALAHLRDDWVVLETEGIIRSGRGLALSQLGRASLAREDFARAEASLVQAGDRALLAAHMIHKLGAAVVAGDMSAASALAEAQALSEAIASADVPRRAHVQHALTLLRGAIAVAPPDDTGPPAAPATLTLNAQGTRLRLPDGRDMDLRRSARTRALVAHLVMSHRERPGTPVTMDALVEVGWPNDRTPEPHRSNRLYVALSRLRASGLGALVLHDGEGYMLDPAVRVVIESA